MICRGCGAVAERVFCDLGVQPLANTLLTGEQLAEAETRYPLRPVICPECMLVQLPELVSPREIFAGDYPYYSSQSAAFVEHARAYTDAMVDRFGLVPVGTTWMDGITPKRESLVVEIASNDGYLLQHFVMRGIRCYGIEPARNVAQHAIRRGVPTLTEFFDASLVCDLLVDGDEPGGFVTGGKADLIVANNVLAHVPNLHGFLQGIRILLADEGVLSVEVPWLVDLVDQAEVGTIYHEHFSYFLLSAIEQALQSTAAPLRVFDVEHLDVHGGSLRVFACHEAASHAETPAVETLRARERAWLTNQPLDTFARRAGALKRNVWTFLSEQIARGRSVAGYCAAAKASTLLSWCGIGTELVPYIMDTTPAKQGRYLPGSRIPIVAPDPMLARAPDVIWILAPNWAPVIVPQLRELCPTAILAWQDGDDIQVREPLNMRLPEAA